MGMFHADFRLHPLGHYLHLYSHIVTVAGISGHQTWPGDG